MNITPIAESTKSKASSSKGSASASASQRSGAVAVHGPSQVARALPRWLPKTSMTGTPVAV